MRIPHRSSKILSSAKGNRLSFCFRGRQKTSSKRTLKVMFSECYSASTRWRGWRPNKGQNLNRKLIDFLRGKSKNSKLRRRFGQSRNSKDSCESEDRRCGTSKRISLANDC